MLRLIIQKELLQNFRSLRLLLTFIIVISLMVISGVLYIFDFEQRVSDFHENQNIYLQKISENASQAYPLFYAVSWAPYWIYCSPNPLNFICEGHENDLPNAFEVNALYVHGPERLIRSNWLLWRFDVLDWTLIITLIISFAAIILTYDSISGEKEDGTLRLMMSNSFSRATLLLGKYLAVLFSLLIPLIMGIILNLLIILTYGSVPLTAGEWLRIFVAIMFSIFYLSTFIMLGLFISSRTMLSVTSLVVSLLIWTVVVIIIPSIGGVISCNFVRIPSEKEAYEQADHAWDIAVKQYEEKHPDVKDISMSGSWDPGQPLARAFAAHDAWNREYDKYQHKLINQIKFARNITRISPSATFQNVMEAVSGSGIVHYEHFFNEAKIYMQNLRRFLIDTYPAKNEHLFLKRNKEAMRTLREMKLDFDAIPKYEGKNVSLTMALARASFDMLLLFLFNVLFFISAFVSFIRYDVR